MKYAYINALIDEFNLSKINKIIGVNWGSKQPDLRHPHLPLCYFLRKKRTFSSEISLKKVPFSIAGKGFEPHDLRVMSPTSYQTALPRDILFINRDCRTPGSNRYDTFVSRDFKSRASANSATPAHSPALGLPSVAS